MNVRAVPESFGRPILLLALALAVSMLLIACGGSGDDDDSAARGENEPTAASGEGSTPVDGGDSALGDNPGASSGGAVTDEVCGVLRGMFVTAAGMADVSMSELELVLEGLATDGPEEIRTELAIFVEALEPWFAALDDIGVGSSADLDSISEEEQERISAITAEMRTDEIVAAEETIQTYVDGEC